MMPPPVEILTRANSRRGPVAAALLFGNEDSNNTNNNQFWFQRSDNPQKHAALVPQ